MKDFALIKLALAAPRLRPGMVKNNLAAITAACAEADAAKANIIVFPEYAVSGFGLGDLCKQRHFRNECSTALDSLRASSATWPNLLIAVGAPLLGEDRVFSAVYIYRAGELLHIAVEGYNPSQSTSLELLLTGEDEQAAIRRLNINVLPGNLYLACREAALRRNSAPCDLNIIMSTEAERVGAAGLRRDLLRSTSELLGNACVYVASGSDESSAQVFGGQRIAACCGSIVSEAKSFSTEDITYAVIDLDMIKSRELSHDFGFSPSREYAVMQEYGTVLYGDAAMSNKCLQLRAQEQLLAEFDFAALAFVPDLLDDGSFPTEAAYEAIEIAAQGLAARMRHSGMKSPVLGVSGGLDSTLALLICQRAVELGGGTATDIRCISMPGFGTGSSSFTHARNLIAALGCSYKEIDIKAACLQHFQDLGHDPAVHDITYENTQARERTQLLMDYANKVNGIVVGTGDLSELALGWCTYNGDHMSMYSVNSGFSKTQIRYILAAVAQAETAGNVALAETLREILAADISPELLPAAADGQTAQKTEDSTGPYIIVDFILYYLLNFGFTREKLEAMAKKVFIEARSPRYEAEAYVVAGLTLPQLSDADLAAHFDTFYRRFTTQQFKRTCQPDGAGGGHLSLSPTAWQMPADLSPGIWN